MNKYAFLAVCLLAALGALLLEVRASPAPQTPTFSASQLDSVSKQFLPAEFRHTNVSLDDIKRVYREKCKKVTGSDNSTLYKDIENAAVDLGTCLSGLANITAVQEEMDAARLVGELDDVFNKYCKKAPEAESCLNAFKDKVKPCLTREEQRQQATMIRLAKSLLGFACSRGGDQLVLFMSVRGPECLEANKEAISHCANKSFHGYMPKDGEIADFMNSPELLFSPTHCVDLQSFEACVVHHLEQCTDVTPANIVQSIFRFVKNETDCKAWMDARANERPILLASANNTGGGASAVAATLTGTLALTLGAHLLRN
ncbi:27 kDa hemolymph protein [Drosophila nasuta]|uniref:27 kDa hemolymph protein n=1 Tax=Drosophila nasuta TaxID=42062 RepID=UPI00295E7FE6|nr:27 kDa hemolymph protein [Drosophila nasuta]